MRLSAKVRELRALQQDPSRAAFASVVAAHRAAWPKLVGMSGEYTFKCALDVFVPLSGLSDYVIGGPETFPIRCKTYMTSLQVLFPNFDGPLPFLKCLHWLYLRNDLGCGFHLPKAPAGKLKPGHLVTTGWVHTYSSDDVHVIR